MKAITIAIVQERATEAWWTTAAKSKELPRELRPLVEGAATSVDVPLTRARELRSWCMSLPGWEAEREPLFFGGMAGRPRSARRSGGTPITVRLSADEHELLDAFANARKQSIAGVLRESALAEARRAESSRDQHPEEQGSIKVGPRGAARPR